MKCVRNIKTGKVVRTSDSVAHKLVDKGKYEFVPKSVWKENGRKYKFVRGFK